MIIGVLREIKQQEHRVALLPAGAYQLTRRGHRVLVERGAGVGSIATAPAGRPLASRSARTETAAAKRKLGFKEKFALEQLPGRMEELRHLKERLQAALADPGLYGRDPGRFGKLGESLADTEAKLGAAEDEWLTLEMLREDIER